MSDRMTRLVVILDKENKESRENGGGTSGDHGASQSTLSPFSAFAAFSWHPGYPGGRGFIWASDLQGLAADVDNFASYIKGEEDITAALVELGVNTEEDAPVTEASNTCQEKDTHLCVGRQVAQ